MTYITTFERRGIEKGIQQGLHQGIMQGMREGIQQGALDTPREGILGILRIRFEMLPATLERRINTLEDRVMLKELLKKAAIVQSVEEFERLPELRQQ